MMAVNKPGKPCRRRSQRRHQKIRDKIEGLPEKFVFQDFRHHFASLLTGDGAVPARSRHAAASTTLDAQARFVAGCRRVRRGRRWPR